MWLNIQDNPHTHTHWATLSNMPIYMVTMLQYYLKFLISKFFWITCLAFPLPQYTHMYINMCMLHINVQESSCTSLACGLVHAIACGGALPLGGGVASSLYVDGMRHNALSSYTLCHMHGIRMPQMWQNDSATSNSGSDVVNLSIAREKLWSARNALLNPNVPSSARWISGIGNPNCVNFWTVCILRVSLLIVNHRFRFMLAECVDNMLGIQNFGGLRRTRPRRQITQKCAQCASSDAQRAMKAL